MIKYKNLPNNQILEVITLKKKISPYCPLVEKCPHYPLKINENYCFLIEPWDDKKEKREETIQACLKQHNTKLKLITADRHQGLGLFCDICKKIQTSSFCIADLSPIPIDLINYTSAFVRPNIMLELGIALAYRKPTIIITNETSKNFIPSDMQGMVYTTFTGDWEDLKKKIIEKLPKIDTYVNEKLVFDIIKESIEKKEMLKIINTIYPYSKLQFDFPNDLNLIEYHKR